MSFPRKNVRIPTPLIPMLSSQENLRGRALTIGRGGDQAATNLDGDFDEFFYSEFIGLDLVFRLLD